MSAEIEGSATSKWFELQKKFSLSLFKIREMNYKEFLIASGEERKKIYINHILDSIRAASQKVGRGFELERLLFDVEKILNEQ